jgi:hypothetical protein
MQTECSTKTSAFGRVEGRPLVAEFDGGALTDAGGLLLGAADRRMGLVRRLAGCFRDARDPRFVEHSVATLVGQRVFGIAVIAVKEPPFLMAVQRIVGGVEVENDLFGRPCVL